MPHVTIRLQVDPVTRKKTVILSYESDPGALPIEHEEEHRRIVDKLIEGGALKAHELGKIVVEREACHRCATGRSHASGDVKQAYWGLHRHARTASASRAGAMSGPLASIPGRARNSPPGTGRAPWPTRGRSAGPVGVGQRL